MSGTDKTFGITGEDVRKVEAKESKFHDGKNPSDSESAALKSLMADNAESKQEKIDRVQANLPLPDQPPQPSDFNSADARTVNVGSGGVSSDVSTGRYGGNESGLRGPATATSSVRESGDELKKNTQP